MNLRIAYLYLSAPQSVPLINYTVNVKIINKVTTGISYKVPSNPLLIKRYVCLPLPGTNRNSHRSKIFVPLGTFFCSSVRFLNILWKSETFKFGQDSLNLTHCAPVRSDHRPSVFRFTRSWYPTRLKSSNRDCKKYFVQNYEKIFTIAKKAFLYFSCNMSYMSWINLHHL